MTDVNTSRQIAQLKFPRGGLVELGGREIRKNDARFTIYIRMDQCLCEYLQHMMQRHESVYARTRKQSKHIRQGSSHPKRQVEL
jgi:hypothetical protein